jgi:PAS domain S-box-containing protein
LSNEIETARLKALAGYGVLDTAPDEAFDRLTGLAAELFDAPMALVSLVDEERQWFKSHHGLTVQSTPRSWAFCAHAIVLDPGSVMVVEDARQDPRFNANPLVVDDPNIRFYAGAVLTSSDGFNLGTLCVLDTESRPAPSDKAIKRLKTLAAMVVAELELRRTRRLLAAREHLLQMAEQVTGIGYWRLDVGTEALTWSEQMFVAYGLEPGAEPALGPAMAMTHPDDRERGKVRLDRALATGQGWRADVTRIVRPDGQMRYVEGHGVCERDADGVVTAVFGALVDVTAHKTLESELRQAQIDAEAAATAKGEFLANMSHELRTPLTSIIGFTGLAMEQADLGGLGRVFVERVGDASRALLCTVNDILDFSKLEAGQVNIERQPASLSKLSRATLDLFTPQAGAKDIDLTLTGDVEAGDLVLLVDPDRIRQVMLNLVGNAVKFTDVGGVTLNVRHDAARGQLAVEVTDTGAGIPAEKLGLLFQRFSQVNGSTTRSVGGAGLGLAICKGLVEAMGGQIGVDSREGHGSRFWFTVPATAAAMTQTASDGAIAMPGFTGARVLVVDDHPANRELAKLFLTGVGAEIAEAEDGEQAVRMAAEWPFDVILMDLRMPKLNGRAALARIRAEDGPNDATPILAFTANADGEMTQQLMLLGFQDVVSKPIEPSALIGAVARALSFSLPMSEDFADAG